VGGKGVLVPLPPAAGATAAEVEEDQVVGEHRAVAPHPVRCRRVPAAADDRGVARTVSANNLDVRRPLSPGVTELAWRITSVWYRHDTPTTPACRRPYADGVIGDMGFGDRHAE
jgi:hypothetical protein